MHTIHINDTGARMFGCQPGRHLVDDVNTGELLTMNWGEEARPFEPSSWDWSASEAAPGDNILFIRAGGGGDILLLTGVLKCFHQKHPDTRITVACNPTYMPMLDGLPFVERIAYPIPVDQVTGFSHVVPLEQVIERSTDPNVDSIDLFAAACGLQSSDLTEPLPVYHLTDDERAAALARFPRQPREKRLGLQQAASAECRTYPLSLLQRIIITLLAEGWTVYRFGAPGEFEKPERDAPEGFVDLTFADPLLSFRESAAVMTTCDVMLTPDSLLGHLAGTLKIPTVALFGPIHWKQRVQRYSSVRAIQGKAPCGPCNHHERGGIRFPVDGPCFHSRYCHALADISPSRVVDHIKDARYSSPWLPISPQAQPEPQPSPTCALSE